MHASGPLALYQTDSGFRRFVADACARELGEAGSPAERGAVLARHLAIRSLAGDPAAIHLAPNVTAPQPRGS